MFDKMKDYANNVVQNMLTGDSTQLTGTIFNRGQALGTWCGTSYEYSELCKELRGTNLQISIRHR